MVNCINMCLANVVTHISIAIPCTYLKAITGISYSHLRTFLAAFLFLAPYGI